MSLNSVAVALDDNDLTRLDRPVLNLPPDSPPTLVLMMIIKNSDRTLDQRYLHFTEADKLLTEYPELQDRIKTAFAAHSFRDIRTLGMFISENSGKC